MHREDFKIFNSYANTKTDTQSINLTYLDSAATSLTPDYVIEKMNEYYFEYKSNIDRGMYSSATRATFEYENARKKVADFINAEDCEVIFTASSTDSSNRLIMMLEVYFKSLATSTRNEILISVHSHHSDLLPLQEYAKRNNLKIVLCADEQDFVDKISEKTLIVSCMHSSNVTGEIFDVKKIFAKAKSFKLKNPKNEEEIFTICDMTASAGHIKINVEELCCDAAYFSAHKMCGPTGVGILYIKRNLMREMYPATFGGGMVSEVLSDSSTYRSDIKRFEAGTPNIAGAIGYGAAVDYINNLDIEKIREHTKNILKYAVEELTKLEDRGVVKIFTEKNFEKNIGIISFEVYKKADLRNKNYKNSDETSNKNLTIHPHDVAQILADNNIAVRSGHHCAALLMDHLAVTSLTRASFYFYNTKKDVDALIQNIIKTQEVFSKQT